jgi:hypothetical protein
MEYKAIYLDKECVDILIDKSPDWMLKNFGKYHLSWCDLGVRVSSFDREGFPTVDQLYEVCRDSGLVNDRETVFMSTTTVFKVPDVE